MVEKMDITLTKSINYESCEMIDDQFDLDKHIRIDNSEK